MQNLPIIAVLYMILSMVSYQISASFAKQLIAALDPLTVTILRLCFAAVIVAVMFRSWKIWSRLPYLKWRDLLMYCASLGLMNILFYTSWKIAPRDCGRSRIYWSIRPSPSFYQTKERIYLGSFCHAGYCTHGTLARSNSTPLFLRRCSLCFRRRALLGVLYLFWPKVVTQNIGMHALTIGITVSAIALLPIGIWYNGPALLDTQYWAKALLIAVLATAIPYALDLMALKQLNKLTYGTLTSLAPALAALTGFLLLHEEISMLQWVALACVMLASIGVTLRSKTAS